MAEASKMQQSESEKQAKRTGRISPFASLKVILRDYLFAIVVAASVAMVVRVYLIEAFRIPTDYMAPTLLPGDHIFVNKVAYTRWMPGSSKKPIPGDIVVFSFPNDKDKDYIKRVVALEGEEIAIQEGIVRINGRPVSQGAGADLYNEVLGGKQYQVQWEPGAPETRKMMPIVVPQGHVFVLGDNRSKGQDSRTWGFLPASYIKGRASFTWFSSGQEGVRWARMFKSIQ